MIIGHCILYVRDQDVSTTFYTSVLAQQPRLYVPGMTEYQLNDGCILGLMPETGIQRLLDGMLPDLRLAHGIPRAELYLMVDDAAPFHQRALHAGARELSPLGVRSWGHRAAYSSDYDGHVLVFADQRLEKDIAH